MHLIILNILKLRFSRTFQPIGVPMRNHNLWIASYYVMKYDTIDVVRNRIEYSIFGILTI